MQRTSLPQAAATLLEHIRTRRASVGIIGLGYVGLPLARTFAAAGFRVLGFDIDPGKVARLNRGESYIGHIPAEAVREMKELSFEATDRFTRFITWPTVRKIRSSTSSLYGPGSP